jgi:ABC-type nitrate/sulfonate/bicarbonate transport system substrate-binding protein
VDVGFVEGGLSELVNTSGPVSLGSVFYEAVLIFYRAAAPIGWLSELKGRRIAIGPEGSGTRFLALTLLKANGIEPKGPTRLLDLGGQAAAQALLTREADAAFLTSDPPPRRPYANGCTSARSDSSISRRPTRTCAASGT